MQTYERAGLIEEAARFFFWLQAWGQEARKIRPKSRILGAMLRISGFYLRECLHKDNQIYILKI